MAGAIGELAHQTLRKNFRSIDPVRSRIILVEGTGRVLPPFPERLAAVAQRTLERRGIEIWTSAKVNDIQADHVMVERNGAVERVETATVIWAAGVRASPLGKLLADAAGAELDRGGRVLVDKELRLPNHPEIYVIGDLAAATYPDGKPLPGVAPAAAQGGHYAADAILKRLQNRTDIAPFRYWDKGNVATIGRNAAVIDLYWLRFSGWFAWVAWLFIHIMFLVHFQNRVLVLIQWCANYVTRNRSARLITGEKINR
jgi:NADH dehydrogenase